MKICRSAVLLLSTLLLLACTAPHGRGPESTYDPLPALFPVQVDYPRNVAGFELREDVATDDPRIGRTLIYAGASPGSPRVHVDIRFGGAYVDGFEALRQQWPALRVGIDELLHATQREVHGTLSDRSRSIRAADGGPERQGRSLRLSLHDAQGRPSVAAFELYFVDPYMISLHSEWTAPEAPDTDAARSRKLDDFAAALIASLKPSQAVLCDPRVQVLKVRHGLSNVSSNGRVIFVSTQTDHLDASTVEELKRAAARQREQVGCAPQTQDFSAVEAQMRARARVR